MKDLRDFASAGLLEPTEETFKRFFSALVDYHDGKEVDQAKLLRDSFIEGDINLLSKTNNFVNNHYIKNKGLASNYSLLHIAVAARLDNVVDSLLKERDLNVNLANSSGDTPLLFALNNNDAKITKALVEKGAKVDQAKVKCLLSEDVMNAIGDPEKVFKLKKDVRRVLDSGMGSGMGSTISS